MNNFNDINLGTNNKFQGSTNYDLLGENFVSTLEDFFKFADSEELAQFNALISQLNSNK